jgi:hypothetical protein
MGLLAGEPQDENFADWPLILDCAARDMERIARDTDFSHLDTAELFLRVGIDFGAKTVRAGIHSEVDAAVSFFFFLSLFSSGFLTDAG